MDRTSRYVIFACALFLVGFELTLERLYPPKPVPHLAPESSPRSGTAPISVTPGPTAPPEISTAALAPPAPGQLSLLENKELKVTFAGGQAAIREIELKNHAEGNSGHVVLNQDAHSGVLELRGWPGLEATRFAVNDTIPGSVVYTTTINGLTWQRTYTLGSDYTIAARDSFRNVGPAPVTLPEFALSLGRAQPLRVGHASDHFSNQQYLGSGWLTSTSFRLTTVGEFDPVVYFWTFKTRDARTAVSSKAIDPSPLRWLGVENQFFTVLLTPEAKHPIESAEFTCLNARNAEGRITPETADPHLEAAAHFAGFTLAPNEQVGYDYTIYAGPKQFARLDALGADQGELMNYGHFELIIRPMLWLLHAVYRLVGNYGVAIICLTLVVKAITWPLQNISNHSGKRMQALAPKLKELQAKHKEQPEKLNSETFALYREYGVNPFGGCLPALVQMPVFFSLYFMLQNLAELRGSHFLWIQDLTQPDTIFTLHLLGSAFPINPLPLMVTGLTMVMMRMTPQIGDPQQAKIAQYMPLVFLFIFYYFAAALSLYYVINNCVSILQIYLNLRKPLPELKRVVKPAATPLTLGKAGRK